MQKIKGKNQSMVRQINQRLVLEQLLKGSKSCTDLARELNLSNTAVAKIIGELKEQNIVCMDETEGAPAGKELGRRPIPFRLNADFASTAVVDVCENSVLVCNMAGVVVAERELGRIDVYNEASIAALVQALHEVLQGVAAPLIAICVITSGILDPVTGEYIFANRFENYKGINLQNIFKKAFCVPVTVVNDTRAALIAEQSCGLLQRANNAVLVNVDIGIAGALLVNGAAYTGDKGFAGEFGLMTEESGETLEAKASLTAVKQRAAAAAATGKCSLPADFHTADVVAAFRAGDPVIREIVLESARAVARAVRNLVHLLDSQVVICGRVTAFGAEYLSVIADHIAGCDYLNTKVQFSALQKSDVGRKGGAKLAAGLGFDTVLRK